VKIRHKGAPAGADVVIFAPSAGPLYGAPGQAGGAELQSYHLARWLAQSGLRVRHVVESSGPMEPPDGIEVVSLGPDVHRRGLPRRRAIVQALRRADGRVYIQRSAGIATGLVAIFARATGRRAIFSASSDGDFTRDRTMMSQMGGSLEQRHVRVQYQVGLRSVHAVVAQTHGQAQLAQASFGIDAEVIRSFCLLSPVSVEHREAFLWIGSLTDVKDPLSFLDLVERSPDVPFWMVAYTHRTRWEQLAAEVRSRAARLANLELLPHRPREELLNLYTRAIAVVNTSVFEGFPNTFLEAWARGTPTVSLRIDPDGVIVRNGLGAVSGGSLETAAARIRLFAEDPTAARTAGEAGRRYIERVHDPGVVGPHWVELVEKQISS
jgi:glycosyltransferase involved in cell wall biosynthesis